MPKDDFFEACTHLLCSKTPSPNLGFSCSPKRLKDYWRGVLLNPRILSVKKHRDIVVTDAGDGIHRPLSGFFFRVRHVADVDLLYSSVIPPRKSSISDMTSLLYKWRKRRYDSAVDAPADDPSSE